jgi:ubiquinone/menaquinone biosynthesis C-methylase UbiE
MYAAACEARAIVCRMSPISRAPTPFNEKMAARLDRMYSSAQVIAQRAKFREVLAAKPGETGVDVGCGLAHLACELAADISPGGKIIALDSSEHMVGEAAARVAAAGLVDRVDVRLGDAAALDLPTASVDFVAAAQVYSYVPDVVRAIREAARVLRPGGRLAVLETDWDLCVYESSDRPLARRILDARALNFAHPHLPRQLHRLMHEAGLSLSQCEAFPIVETRHDPDSFGAGLLPVLRSAAVRDGIGETAVDGWIGDVQSRTGEGDYFFATCRFIFLGRR